MNSPNKKAAAAGADGSENFTDQLGENSSISNRIKYHQSTDECGVGDPPVKVDLDKFMAAIFREVEGVPVVAAADHKGFMAQRYTPGVKPQGDQLYFCISSVRDIPRAGLLKRQMDDLVKTYAAVIDDAGTKCPLPTVPPTWVIESSPGNFQYGYRLNPPAEPGDAAALVNALIAGGHTDPGAGGANRVMRVPGSLNTKPQHNGWRAQVTEWHPERHFSLDDLRELFGVKVGAPVSGRALAPAQGGPDAVFDWLLGHGMVKEGPNLRGWYSLTCPWECQHQTYPLDHGTDYAPGAPGAFKCLHASCARQSTATLKAWIVKEDPEANIGIIPHELVLAVSAALREAMVPSMSLRERLALEIRGAPLGPHLLPDCKRTLEGNANQKQTVTEIRVEHVLKLIGAGVRHNAMNGDIEMTIGDYKSVDDPSDAGMATIVHACDQCGMTGAAAIRQAVVNIAMTNKFHPAEDWIRSAPWDGIDRLPALFESIIMRDPSQNHWRDIVVRRWTLQVAAAIGNYKLGDVALDVGYVLTLQGQQGSGKSRWVSSLMPGQFVTMGLSLKLDTNERDAVTRATAKPIGELGELDGSFRRSDTAATKNFLTTRVDFYRAPYAVKEAARPRCTAFVATVNPEGFLIDATGERRFWPLAVARCNWDHGVNMQQFWAQIWDMRERGEQYWLCADEIVLHAGATKKHAVESDIGFVVQELVSRRQAFPDNKEWVHSSSKAILDHYAVRTYSAAYTDFNTALAREGFIKTIVHGKAGWRVPPYTLPLTPAQRAGFGILKDKKP